MRFNHLELKLEAFEDAKTLGGLMDSSSFWTLGMAAHLWRWGLARTPEGVPVTGVFLFKDPPKYLAAAIGLSAQIALGAIPKISAEQFFDECCAAGIIDAIDGGFRIRGLTHYETLRVKYATDAERKRIERLRGAEKRRLELESLMVGVGRPMDVRAPSNGHPVDVHTTSEDVRAPSDGLTLVQRTSSGHPSPVHRKSDRREEKRREEKSILEEEEEEKAKSKKSKSRKKKPDASADEKIRAAVDRIWEAICQQRVDCPNQGLVREDRPPWWATWCRGAIAHASEAGILLAHERFLAAPGFAISGWAIATFKLASVWQHRARRALPGESGAVPKQPETPAGQAWAEILSKLTADGKDYGVSWLLKMKPISLDEGVLSLECPDRFFADWLGQHYLPLLGDAAAPNTIALTVAAVTSRDVA